MSQIQLGVSGSIFGARGRWLRLARPALLALLAWSCGDDSSGDCEGADCDVKDACAGKGCEAAAAPEAGPGSEKTQAMLRDAAQPRTDTQTNTERDADVHSTPDETVTSEPRTESSVESRLDSGSSETAELTDTASDAEATSSDTTTEIPEPDAPGRIGAACEQDGDCRSELCIAELDSAGAESGWGAGYCVDGCGEGEPKCPLGSSCFDFGEDLFLCLATCTNNLDCRDEYACNQPAPAACLPRCDLHEADCPDGYFCSKSGRCEVEDAPVEDCCTAADLCFWAGDGICDCEGTQTWDAADCALPELFAIGAACAADAECESALCLTETDDQGATGWPGGYCLGDCTGAPDACPEGSACFRVGTDGESACLSACSTGTDCREEYACDPSGACLPRCDPDTNPCAEGTHCVSSGVCEADEVLTLDGGFQFDAGRVVREGGVPLPSDGGSAADSGACAVDEFDCQNGLCVPEIWQCDALVDCPGAVDEVDCVNGAPTGWTCAGVNYGGLDGCDCACGVWDPDCAIDATETYGCFAGEVCERPGECTGG